MLVACVACSACDAASGPAEPLDVEIVGHDHRWLVRYPGPDGRLGTPDDLGSQDGVRLPGGTAVRLTLASADYDYIFRVPELGVNELAAQVYTGQVELETGQPAVYAIHGDVLCGWPEPGLESEIRVEPPASFERWVESLDPWRAPAGATDPPGA